VSKISVRLDSVRRLYNEGAGDQRRFHTSILWPSLTDGTIHNKPREIFPSRRYSIGGHSSAQSFATKIQQQGSRELHTTVSIHVLWYLHVNKMVRSLMLRQMGSGREAPPRMYARHRPRERPLSSSIHLSRSSSRGQSNLHGEPGPA
jgi:hypothetical protein